MTTATMARESARPDVSALLAPISTSAPAGQWLLYEGTYDKIREARRDEDPSLPQGIWQRELKRANWAEVQELAVGALVRRSKDLQIAAWLLEAWTHLRGFEGARQGLELMLDLSEQYWDTLYPLPDGDDFSVRSLIVTWVNERLGSLLEGIPLTRPTTSDGRVWTWSQRLDALRAENLMLRGKEAPRADDNDVLTSARMFAGVAATPQAFYVDCDVQLAASIATARAIEAFFDERCGVEAPTLTKLIGVLSTIHEWVAGVLAEQLADVPPSPPEPVPEQRAPSPSIDVEEMAEDIAEPSGGPLLVGDHARTRAETYRKLAEAAHTLMRIEPHSPTPYLVFRAIAWGEMSLAELMRHFISSGYDLKSLYAMLDMDEMGSGK